MTTRRGGWSDEQCAILVKNWVEKTPIEIAKSVMERRWLEVNELPHGEGTYCHCGSRIVGVVASAGVLYKARQLGLLKMDDLAFELEILKWRKQERKARRMSGTNRGGH